MQLACMSLGLGVGLGLGLGVGLGLGLAVQDIRDRAHFLAANQMTG